MVQLVEVVDGVQAGVVERGGDGVVVAERGDDAGEPVAVLDRGGDGRDGRRQLAG